MDDGNTTESERWLTTAAKLLASGDFQGARTFAIRARESAPLLADQILAVADTLLTAQSNPRDWYGILQLVPLTQSMEAVESQYRKLTILLNPGKNNLSFADQAFRFVSGAWNVLSNPSNKLVFDNELRLLQFGHVNQLNQQQQQIQQLQPQTQPVFMQPPPPPPPGTNQINNQTESNQTELTKIDQINQPAIPAPATEHSQTEPTDATRDNNSTQASQATESVGTTFWTACPHCCSRFEYPQVYEDCTLRCQTKDCRRAFQAVAIPSPSVQTELPWVSRNTDSTRSSQATGSGTFWTACPYCYALHEYPKVYEDCTLMCPTKGCRRAFHAAVAPSPLVNGKETYFCCWAFFPIGLSGSGNCPSWSPISTMFACRDNKNAGKQNTKKSAPRVFYDEDDVYVDISDSSASFAGDDDDWRNERREKKVNNSKGKGSKGRNGKKPQSDRVKKGSNDKIDVDCGGNLNGVPTAESSRRGVASSGRKQMKRGTKVLGKLDLNVEFRNEVEEPVAGRSKGNHAGNEEEEEEDKNEGNGFLEGLDEFFSSLPILSVVGDDEVKATE